MKPGDNLALAFQEVLTAAARLRAENCQGAGVRAWQVRDVNGFRDNVQRNLQSAHGAARDKGYPDDIIKLAVFAVVALLDETAMKSANPALKDWHKQPLAQTLFKHLDAGEVVFTNIETLLTRDDSPAVADVLEVYYICLLLGFSGRYHQPTAPGLAPIQASVRSKIERIRGRYKLAFPAAVPAGGAPVAVRKDRWAPRLGWIAGAAAIVCLIAFGLMQYSLSAGLERIASVARQVQ